MAILNEELVESDQGLVKKIDEEGVGLLMDMAQKGQYAKPIESTIREVASNGIDSIRERDNAKLILTGEAKVEDFYADREGEIYNASKFKAEYYDLSWLDENSTITIEHFRRDNEERDLLRITDHGVGLGGSRLEGYMSLSYSTKRLNKSALGKFGIGGKAPLATNVDSFIMKTNYNGWHSEWEIFSRKVESIIPKWNEVGEENKSNYFSEKSNNYQYFTTPTLEKNSVTVEVETKKSQRDAFKQAVVNQLLYFSNVRFLIYHDVTNVEEASEQLGLGYSYKEEVPVTTEIFYQSSNFLISKNNLYTKPHVVIGQPGAMVNYGLIDWGELELSPRSGNVGIIIDASEVDITPSRESVIWSSKTKELILKKFELALKEANEVVNKELEDPDFLQWIAKSQSLLSPNGSNKIVRELSGLIDKSQIISSYTIDPSIKYDTFHKMVGGDQVKFKEILSNSRYHNGKNRTVVDRKSILSFTNTDLNRLYFTELEADGRKDTYIQSTNGGTFYLITIPYLSDKWWAEEEGDRFLFYKIPYRNLATKEGEEDSFVITTDEQALLLAEKYILEKKESYLKGRRFLELSKTSTLYHDYDTVEVPEDWKADLYDPFDHQKIADEIGLPVQAIKRDSINHTQRRKDNGLIFFKYANYSVNSGGYVDFGFKQKEVSANELNSFPGTLVYATNPTKEELAKFPTTTVVIDSNGTTETNIDNLENIDTDDNLLKVVSMLLLGEISNTEDTLSITGEKERYSSRIPFKNKYSDYSFYPGISNTYGSKDLMLIKVAKPLAKKLTDFIPVREFVLSIDKKTNTATTHKKLMNWYTAKRIAPFIYSIPFLQHFAEISSHHHKEYMELYNLVRKFNIYSDNDFTRLTNFPTELHKKLVQDFDDLADFQLFVKEGHTTEEIGEYAKEKLGATLSDALIIDMEIYTRAVELVEWAAPIKELMNNIPYFVSGASPISIQQKTNKPEFLESVRGYLRSKSVEMIELPVEIVEINHSDEENDIEDED